MHKGPVMIWSTAHGWRGMKFCDARTPKTKARVVTDECKEVIEREGK